MTADRPSDPDPGRLKRARLGWAAWLVLLVLSAYIVPYAWLGRVAKVGASFLYWLLWALIAVTSILALMRRWRD
ncbi:MAG: hypothetical protein ACPLPT_08165 [Moorellales bacterium]